MYRIKIVDKKNAAETGKLVEAREVLTAFNTLTIKCYDVMKEHYLSISIVDEKSTVKRTFRY